MSSINSLNIKSQDYIISGFTEIIICSTQASTVAKTATAPDAFNLDTNASFKIKFTNGNSANQPTLNLNDTGDKNLVGTNGTNLLVANQIYDCHYDGTQYVINNSVDIVNSVESGNMSPITSNAVANWHPTSFTVGDIHMGINNNIYADGTKACHSIIRFIDNTTDTAGNGVVIGGGGAVIIGGGESANVYRACANITGGSEVMVVTNDTSIEFVTNLDGGYACRKSMTMGSDGKLTNSQGFVGNLTGTASYATSAGTATSATCATKDGSGCTFGTAARYSCDCFRPSTWTPTSVDSATQSGISKLSFSERVFQLSINSSNTSYNPQYSCSFGLQLYCSNPLCTRIVNFRIAKEEIDFCTSWNSVYIQATSGFGWVGNEFDDFDFRIIGMNNCLNCICANCGSLLYTTNGSNCFVNCDAIVPSPWISGHSGMFGGNINYSHATGWFNGPQSTTSGLFPLTCCKCCQMRHVLGLMYSDDVCRYYNPIVEIKVYDKQS